MKRIFILPFILIAVGHTGLFAQATKSEIRNSITYKLERGVYNRALKYNDIGIAVNALYNLCVLEPQNDSLLYALQYLYFNNQQYISSVLVANDVLLLNNKNTGSQEMKAMGLEQIGAKDKAIEEYESLYLKNSNNLDYLYKTAFLQYGVKRYKEALTNVDILLGKPQADSVKLTFDKGNNEQQQVPMKASLYNLKGMIQQAQGKMDDARKQFNLSLQPSPDFFLAKQNLDSLAVRTK